MATERISLLLVSQLFHPAFTGAGLRFLRYASGFRARGIDMCVFTSTNGTLGYEDATEKKSSTVDHIGDLPIWRVNLSSDRVYQRELAFVSTLIHHCKFAAPNIDLLHFVSPSPYYLMRYHSLRQLNLPIIVSHTLHTGVARQKWKQLMLRFFSVLTYQVADCIVTNTTAASQSLAEHGIRKPVVMIPNGVDLEKFRPEPDPKLKRILRKQLGVDFNPNTKLVLFVGSLTRRKGIDILFKAWEIISREHDEAILVLVGPTTRETENLYLSDDSEIDHLISGKKVRDRIIFTGKVDNVEDYYRVADIFVFPSLREGMPNTLLEAFSSGMPCIITPFVGLSNEFGNPGEQFVMVERSDKELAHATLRLLDDPFLCKEIGHRARAWVEQHLSLENSLDMYSALYRKWAVRQ